MASIGALLGGDPTETRRRQLRQSKHRLSPAFCWAAVLISLTAMGLVMWFISIFGQHVRQLRGYLLHSAAAARSAVARHSTTGVLAGGSDNNSTASAVSGHGNLSNITTFLLIADLSTTMPMMSMSHGFECLSDTHAGGTVYPKVSTVTQWRTNEDLDAPCPVVSENSAELFIKQDGYYFLHSQAQLSGVMYDGIVLRKFIGEKVRHSLKIRHIIVCWRNCIGASGRSSNRVVILREVEVTVLDVQSTNVAVQVRLQSGSTVGVMVTSPNLTASSFGTWQKFVLSVTRLS